MTTPDHTKYADRSPNIPHSVAKGMVQTVKDNEPMKPWTLVERVAAETGHENVRIDVLKPLVLEGVLTPNADGDIKLYEEHRLSRITTSEEP